MGVDVNNQPAVAHNVIDASNDQNQAVTEITLEGLQPGTKYSAFCTATNGYLVWPSFVTVSKEAQTPENFTTKGEQESDDSDDDDSALLVSSNIVAICTMIAALIFN